MVVHLTIADLIVSFVVIPLEIGWRISVQWVAGNAACKALMFIRAFAFYLSSMTLVCLSLDRTRRRGRIMIVSAWVAASFFAMPQTLVFRVLKHPQIDFYQCTSMDFFREIMSSSSNDSNNNDNTTTTIDGDNLDNVTQQISTNETLFGLGPEVYEKIYSCIFLVAVYMVPLLVIIITYANILCKIIRKKQESSSSRRTPTTESSASDFGGKKRGSSLHYQTGGRVEMHHFSAQSVGSKTSMVERGGQSSRMSRKNVFLNRQNTTSEQGGPSSSGPAPLCRNRSLRFARSQTVALRMSTMHVLAFVSCWTPYLVISLWHVIDPASVDLVSPEVQDALFLTAVFNSSINPLVYGGFYLKAMRSRSNNKRTPSDRGVMLQQQASVRVNGELTDSQRMRRSKMCRGIEMDER